MDLFLKLRQIREEKGLLLEDIAREYRIQIKYLQAIEQGRFQELPPIYDQLFFRSYLKALEVNEDEYLGQFFKLRGLDDGHKPEQKISPSDHTTGWESMLNYQSLLKSKNLYIFMPFVVMVIILIILLTTTRSIQTETNMPVKEIDVQSIAAALRPPAPVDTVDSMQINDKKLNLLVYGLKNTWFRIITDKRDTAEYMLKRGNQLSTKAGKTFELVIGRADGLQFTLNDKHPQQVSADSVVVSYLLIDSSGIAAKRLKQPKPSSQTDSTADKGGEIQ
jgi:transcriptional regulator with XRE-family HTH domain